MNRWCHSLSYPLLRTNSTRELVCRVLALSGVCSNPHPLPLPPLAHIVTTVWMENIIILEKVLVKDSMAVMLGCCVVLESKCLTVSLSLSVFLSCRALFSYEGNSNDLTLASSGGKQTPPWDLKMIDCCSGLFVSTVLSVPLALITCIEMRVKSLQLTNNDCLSGGEMCQ